MGQMVHALMYGIEVPKSLEDQYEDDGIEDGLLEAYEEEAPDMTPDASLYLMGYVIAAGSEGKRALVTFALDSVSNVYAERIAQARDRWSRFAIWALVQGHKLPEGRLYLTEIETA